MGHYRSNLRDLRFALFEVFHAERALGHGPFKQMDADSAVAALTELERLCSAEVAASFATGDRTPPTFDADTGSVTLPAEFTDTLRTLIDGEWWRLDLPDHLGGLGASPSVRWAASELLLGANPAAFMYLSGACFGAILDRLGTPAQQDYARRSVERHWGATMVLTEPDAGSDVGAGRTRAVPQPDGTWHIEGVKRFITNGDWDLPENISHLVLARPEGAPPGTKGLSLFLVPKVRVLPDGTLGERNGVYATRLEAKMGLKVSATCELTFGGTRGPAVGELVGGVHDGIAQMFEFIQYARMMVGTKAIATLSTGYLNALDYARTRIQGPDLTRAGDPTAPRVPVTRHPDVRRMLLLQKSYAEGMRALVLFTAGLQDEVALAEADALPDGPAGGGGGGTDQAARGRTAAALNDLLLPVVKGVGSERSYALLALSLQTLGGSGYLQDHPIEQYLRDAKIDTVYEGTTGIQGNDLFFRKILRDGGRALTDLSGRIAATAADGRPELAEERALLARALEDVGAMVAAMTRWAAASRDDPGQVYRVGLNTDRLLMSLGDLVIGWLLLWEADVAAAALGGGAAASDGPFYAGKVAGARFFARTVLPELGARRAVTEATDGATTQTVMDLPDEAF